MFANNYSYVNRGYQNNKIHYFDFYSAIAQGRTLFVGEGNFSFSLSITSRLNSIYRNNIIASTIEKQSDFSADTSTNVNRLLSYGIKVYQCMDATQVPNDIGYLANIVFQFPNAGSREPVEGRNPNFILLRDFLKQAYKLLIPNGRAIVTIVNNDYYINVFNPKEAGGVAGFKNIEIYKFIPSNYSGYEHCNTHDDESGLENHNSFVTLVFRK